jgi:hypothetical protein
MKQELTETTRTLGTNGKVYIEIIPEYQTYVFVSYQQNTGHINKIYNHLSRTSYS